MVYVESSINSKLCSYGEEVVAVADAPHLHFHIIDSDSVFWGEGLFFVFKQFEFMGPFDLLEDNLENSGFPKEERNRRYKDIPLGDAVVKFLKSR